MVYDEDLADRVRGLIGGEPGLTEKRMFGGLAFLINGNMTVSASGQGGLLLRVEPARTDILVREPDVSRAVMRGREMDGWLRLDTSSVTVTTLQRWIDEAVSYARSLPPR